MRAAGVAKVDAGGPLLHPHKPTAHRRLGEGLRNGCLHRRPSFSINNDIVRGRRPTTTTTPDESHSWLQHARHRSAQLLYPTSRTRTSPSTGNGTATPTTPAQTVDEISARRRSPDKQISPKTNAVSSPRRAVDSNYPDSAMGKTTKARTRAPAGSAFNPIRAASRSSTTTA